MSQNNICVETDTHRRLPTSGLREAVSCTSGNSASFLTVAKPEVISVELMRFFRVMYMRHSSAVLAAARCVSVSLTHAVIVSKRLTRGSSFSVQKLSSVTPPLQRELDASGSLSDSLIFFPIFRLPRHAWTPPVRSVAWIWRFIVQPVLQQILAK